MSRVQRLQRHVIEPLFASLSDAADERPAPGQPALPLAVRRNRRERAQLRLAQALASRGVDLVPEAMRTDLAALCQAWAAQGFADAFPEVEAFEIRCAEELDQALLAIEPEAPDQDDPDLLQAVFEPVADPALLSAERAYRQIVLDGYGRIELRWIGAQAEPVLLRIDQLYAPLSLVLQGGGGAPVPAPALLAEAAHTLITGGPGSGKTTLLTYLAARAAAGGLRSMGQSLPPEPVPFLIPVRWLSGYRPRLDPEALGRATGCTPDFVAQALSSGRALVLLDGMDECPKENAGRLWASLGELAARHPDNRILCTARPESLPDLLPLLPFSDIQVAGLCPLGLHDPHAAPGPAPADQTADQLLCRWYLCAERLTQQSEELAQARAQAGAQSLREQILRLPMARELAAVPGLLVLLCALHRHRGGHLPEGASELLAGCLDLLLRAPRLRALEPAQRTALLADLAAFLHRARAVEVPAEWVAERLGAALSAYGRDPGEAAPLLHELMEGSGLLCERTPGHLSFRHLVFQRYLTALSWVLSGKYDLRPATASDPWWREVIVLCAAVPGADRGRLLQWIEKTPERSSNSGM
jgi:hypothetical protein